MGFKKLLTLVLLVTATGCAQHVGNFTALSSATFKGEEINQKHLVKQNAYGEACTTILLGIPLGGLPKVDQAVSEALRTNNGDIMTNASLYVKNWSALLVGQTCWTVAGDVYKTSN